MSASVYPGHSPIPSIVFVHGILGNHESAWTDEKTKILWPRDFLPHDIKASRILSFKYSPNLGDFFAEDEAGCPRVAQHARGLGSALHHFRARTETVAVEMSA